MNLGNKSVFRRTMMTTKMIIMKMIISLRMKLVSMVGKISVI